jgi:hypothetical protein
VLKLIKFNLPPLHKSTAFLNPTDYLSEYAPTLPAFDPPAIPTSGRVSKEQKKDFGRVFFAIL